MRFGIPSFEFHLPITAMHRATVDRHNLGSHWWLAPFPSSDEIRKLDRKLIPEA